MTEFIVTYAIALLLGFGAGRALYWWLPEKRRARIAALVLMPPLALFAFFLYFFDFTPVGEDWTWLFVGFGFFFPWWIVWFGGVATEKLVRRALSRRRGQGA